MVEISGIEPLTSWMPFKRSPSWAIPPDISRYGILGEPLLNCRTASGFGAHLGVRKCVVRAPSWAIPPCSLFRNILVLNLALCCDFQEFSEQFLKIKCWQIPSLSETLWCCSPDTVRSQLSYTPMFTFSECSCSESCCFCVTFKILTNNFWKSGVDKSCRFLKPFGVAHRILCAPRLTMLDPKCFIWAGALFDLKKGTDLIF